MGTLLWSTFKIIRGHKDPAPKFLWAINFGILFQFVIVGKHYSSHYLLPGICLFSSAFLLFYIGRLAQHNVLRRLTAAFIIIFTLQALSQAIMYRSQLASLTKGISALQKEIYAQYPGCAVIASADTNPFFSQSFALLFADRFYSMLLFGKSYTHKESEKLSLLYPRSYYLNFDGTSTSPDNPGYGICDFKKRVYADDVLASNPYVLFINYKFDFYAHGGFDFSEHPYTARLIKASKYADIYLLTSSTDKEASELLSASSVLFERGQYKEAFALALRSRELNYQPRNQVEFILSIIYNHLHQH